MAEKVEWVRIERTIKASKQDLWRMWTDPEHFARWYGPNGASVEVIAMDVRKGGQRFIRMDMQTPNGAMSMWFIGEYTDITPFDRLSYQESMSDEQGNVMAPESIGLPPGHPETTEVIILLTGVDARTTTMQLTHVGVPAGSGGAGGWAQAFDKLETQLST